MGSVVPIAFQAIQAAQAISSVAKVVGRGISAVDDGRKQSVQALDQLEARQKVEQRNAQEKANLQRQEILTQAQEKEANRVRELKRAVARQRAAFGGSGLSSADGSSQAVLLGLFEESEEEKAERERLDNLRLSAIDQNLAQAKRVNTLELAQQREKSRLKNSSSNLEDAVSVLSIF